MLKGKFLIPLYLLKETIPSIIISLAILSILVFCQQLSRNSEFILSPLIDWKTSTQILLSLLPPIFTFTLPVAIVLGEIVTLSRLAADFEWFAMEAATLGNLSRFWPFLFCGALGFVLLVALNWNVGPQSIARVKAIRNGLTLDKVAAQVRPQIFVSQFPDHLLRIKSVDRFTGKWEGVLLLKKDAATAKIQLLAAQSGRLTPLDQSSNTFEIKLSNGIYIDNLLSANNHITSAFKENTLKLSTTKQRPDTISPAAQDSANQTQLEGMDTLFRQLTHAQDKATRNEIELEIARRFANAFACIYAACVALVLSTSFRQRSSKRTLLIFASFLLLVIFYASLTLGQNLAIKGKLSGEQGVLVGCLIPSLILLALYFALSKNIIGRSGLLSVLPATVFRPNGSDTPTAGLKIGRNYLLKRPVRNIVSITPTSPPINLGHYLIFSEFAKFLALTVTILTMTVLLFTLLDIAPSLAKRNIHPGYALVYLINLSPQIVYYVMPFTILIAVVATATSLARTGQLTILLYYARHPLRLALPVLISTITVIILIFYISDSVLPFTNREQDYRYKRIKGKALEEATIAFDRQWIASGEDTVYGYHLSEDNGNHLLNALIFHLDNPGYYLSEVIYLERMQLDLNTTTKAEDAANFRYLIGSDGLAKIDSFDVNNIPPELKNREALYEKTYHEASKMTYQQLKDYIGQVEKTGLSTLGLRVEQMQKLAFPFACLTLLFLAFPICLLQIQRQHQSRLSAIAVSITLALVFWAILSIFEAAGKRGILPIALAAWSPHALFLALAITIQFRLHHP